jgi:hypothetical protein
VRHQKAFAAVQVSDPAAIPAGGRVVEVVGESLYPQALERPAGGRFEYSTPVSRSA